MSRKTDGGQNGEEGEAMNYPPTAFEHAVYSIIRKALSRLSLAQFK
jgi:hypothetical protein